MTTVLIVDNDRDIGELVRALLTDEGYDVSCLYEHGPNDLPAAVGRLEPDCVILDGEAGKGGDYGSSWGEAADLRARGRKVPVIMFTAHDGASTEAEAGESERARAAGFSSVIRKPFDVDQLVDAVAKATGESAKYDASQFADFERSRSLAAKVEKLGGRDVRASTRREWITFRAPDDSLFQLYWWQKGGCYYVGAYLGTGGRMESLGLFYDVDGAVACAELALKTHAAPV